MNKNNRINKTKFKLKDYFEYNRRNNVSITRVVSMVLFAVIVFNIVGGIMEIKNMQSYIVGNSGSHELRISSKRELENIEKEATSKNINIGNVRKIFEVAGVENIEKLHIDQNSATVVGRASDVRVIEKLMKNKLLKGSHVKRIEGGDTYKFEIATGDGF